MCRLAAGQQPSVARVPALGTMLLGCLLLVACGTGGVGPTAGSQTQPVAQRTVAPERPHPLGNGITGGSFGAIDALTLPAAPTVAVQRPPAPPVGAAPTQQPGAVAVSSHGPAPAAGANAQAQPLPAMIDAVRGRLLYAGTDGRLSTVGREGNDARVLLEKPAGADPPGRVAFLNLSPDSEHVLYTVLGVTPAPRNYLLDLTSGAVSQQPFNGTWAPDSRHVATASGPQLVVLDVVTGAQETLGEGSNAGWTADGDLLAVRNGNIWLIPYPTSRGAARPLSDWPTSGAGAWTYSGPLQYHFSNRVLFAGAPRGDLDAAGNGLRLHALDIATRQLTDLSGPSGNQVRFMTLSPSGMQLAAAGQLAQGTCASSSWVQVMRADRAGTAVSATLPQTGDSFAYVRGLTWSPDQWVAYSALQQRCAGGTLTDQPPEKIYLFDPAHPGAPRYLVDGAFPVWVMPRGLGFLTTGVVAGE